LRYIPIFACFLKSIFIIAVQSAFVKHEVKNLAFFRTRWYDSEKKPGGKQHGTALTGAAAGRTRRPYLRRRDHRGSKRQRAAHKRQASGPVKRTNVRTIGGGPAEHWAIQDALRAMDGANPKFCVNCKTWCK